MPITVRDLLDLPGLGLSVVAGSAELDRQIRWAHTSELEDPTPWLSGGELLLTTGMALKEPQAQRAYITRLASAGLAGLGFGVGFDFDEVPGVMLAAAEDEGFPLLEVPFPVPFIAIAEAVSTKLAAERLKDAQMSVEVHERLASLVSEGSGPADLLDEVIDLCGGWAMLFDLRGEVMARAQSRAVRAPEPGAVWDSLPAGLAERRGPVSTSELGPEGARVGLAVTAGRRQEGVFVFGKDCKLSQRDRITVHHAVTVLGLLLASRRAVIEAERRVAGDVLVEAFAGRLTGPELERRLELVGFPLQSRVAALVVEGPPQWDEQALEELTWAIDASLGGRVRAVRSAVMGERVAALVGERDPEAAAGALADELVAAAPSLGFHKEDIRIGMGEAVPTSSARHSYLCAVMALRASSTARIAGPRDLGSYGFLLGAQPRPVLESYVRSVLGPLIERDRDKSSDLVSSVKAFVDAGGRWEPGADALGVHRHTLRYRVRQAEELLGRDLSCAEDRLEVWLALKAAEILEE
jgi:purine catabolism regulator